jgi:serine phosphatase RsbU (regulator of sigma subunit)
VSIELTPEQQQALDSERGGALRVIDPRTNVTYQLVRDTTQEMARAVQTRINFLPKPTETDGYQFFTHCEPALEVGGDFCDLFPLPNGSWALLIGDVAGKGLSAAFLMGRVNSDARLCILTKEPLQEAISTLNQMVIDLGTDRFVTMIAGLLDPLSHQLTLVNAGHIPALRYHRSSSTVQEVIDHKKSGPPLGIVDMPYTAVTVELQPEDCILFITDGITEALNPKGEQFGFERVRAVMLASPCKPAATALQLIESVKAHADGRNQFDDLTVVCFARSQFERRGV